MVRTIPTNLAKVARRDHWLREIDRAEGWLRSLVPRKPRTRRALLQIIGDIARDLIGTSTVEEVEELRSKVIENRNSLEKIINFDQELLTIVNVTHEELIKNRKTLNEIINATHFLQDQINTIVQRSAQVDYALITYNMIEEKMTLIWRHIQELQRLLDEYGFIKHALEEGRLDEYLLPSSSLTQILQHHQIPGTGMIVPVEWYYTNCHVIPFWGDDFLAFIVHLPLIETTQYSGFKIETFPVPLPNSTTTVRLQTEGIIAVSTSGAILHLRQCVGDDPIVCDPSPVRKDSPSTHSCAQSLIMKDSEVQKRCPAILETHPEGLIYTRVPNHMIFVTWGEAITEQCEGNVHRASLASGTYQIYWPGQCFITTQHWTIPGVVTRDYNKSVDVGWLSWDIPNFELPKLIVSLNTTLRLPQRLSAPKTIRLHLPSAPTSFITQSHNHTYYYLIALICVIPIVAIIVFVCKKHEWNKCVNDKCVKQDCENTGVIEQSFKLPLPTRSDINSVEQ